MVALATQVLGGIRRPSLARPMLQSAAVSFTSGRPIEAAARLKEALRRELAAEADRHGVGHGSGSVDDLIERLCKAGAEYAYVTELIEQCEDVLTFREPPRHVGRWIELAFGLIEEDKR